MIKYRLCIVRPDQTINSSSPNNIFIFQRLYSDPFEETRFESLTNDNTYTSIKLINDFMEKGKIRSTKKGLSQFSLDPQIISNGIYYKNPIEGVYLY